MILGMRLYHHTMVAALVSLGAPAARSPYKGHEFQTCVCHAGVMYYYIIAKKWGTLSRRASI